MGLYWKMLCINLQIVFNKYCVNLNYSGIIWSRCLIFIVATGDSTTQKNRNYPEITYTMHGCIYNFICRLLLILTHYFTITQFVCIIGSLLRLKKMNYS